jgi:hypothetical protein
MRLSRFLAATAATALIATGCGDGDGGATVNTVAASTTSTPGAATVPPTGTVETTTTTTTTTTAAVPVIAGLAPIEQRTPNSGGGSRPLLSWAPVDGAAVYVVMVYDADRSPYWSAVTTATEVYVGGPVQIPTGNDGPRIGAGYTWSVYAEDAGGLLIAASPQRDLSP